MSIALSASSVVFFLLSVSMLQARALASDSFSDICFEQYTQSVENASSVYKTEYNECTEIYNNDQELIGADEAIQREQLKAGTEQLCGNFAACNALENEIEFLHCYSQMGPANDELITAIQTNSSRAAISFNESYTHAEKLYRLCIMDAENNYKQRLNQALADLHVCLSSAYRA